MNAFPIRDNSDLSRAIQLVDALWDAPNGSPDAELREVMAELIEHFEARELSRVLPPANPRELIAAKCRELGLSQRKLGERLGWTSAGRVSEVLAGKRRITLDMVRDLERVLAIPAGLLIADREATEAGDVWLRIPADLVAAAQSCGFAGCDGLDALVREAVAARVEAKEWTPSTSSAPRTAGGANEQKVRRQGLSILSDREAA